MLITKGELINFEGGEYSDKWWTGPFRVLRDLDQTLVSKAFMAQYVSDECGPLTPSGNEFITWLTKEGYIGDEPNTHCWYLGGYEFEPQYDTA